MLAPQKKKLYIWAGPEELAADARLAAAEPGLRPFYQPERGAYVLEFDDAAARREQRQALLEAGLLATNAPAPTETVRLWRGFLTGQRSVVAFNLWALLASPLWLMSRGLWLKLEVLSIAYCGVAILGALLPEAAAKALADGAASLLWLYPALFGEYDSYLLAVPGERLWPALPYARFKYLVHPLCALALAGAIAGGVTLSASREFEWQVPAGGAPSLAARFTIEESARLSNLSRMEQDLAAWQSAAAGLRPATLAALPLAAGRELGLPAAAAGTAPGESLPVTASCLTEVPAIMSRPGTRLELSFAALKLKVPTAGWGRACVLLTRHPGAPAGKGMLPMAVVWFAGDVAAAEKVIGTLGPAGPPTAPPGGLGGSRRTYFRLAATPQEWVVGEYLVLEPGGEPLRMGVVYPSYAAGYIDRQFLPAAAAALAPGAAAP